MDSIGDFLTMIRNAGNARHEKVDLPASGVKAGIAQILMEAGFIRSFKVARDSKQGLMRIYLRYNEEGRHAIQSIDRASRPGRRLYVKSTEIPVVRSGTGTSILSTSHGIMTGDKAKAENLGGELICTLW